MPDENLVRRQNRPAEILLDRLDRADAAATIAAEEDRIGIGRYMRPRPFIDAAGLCVGRVSRHVDGSGERNREAGTGEIGLGPFGDGGLDPGRVDDREPLRAQRAQGYDGRQACRDDGNAVRAPLEALDEPAIVFDGAEIARVGEAQRDDVNQRRSHQRRRIVGAISQGFGGVYQDRRPVSDYLIGLDYHDASIATARRRAAEQGVAGNIAFEVKAATQFDGRDFDFICFMDCLHDLGDPAGALARCRKALKPGGKVMLVEPYAGDRLEENLNPIGRMYYAASAMACTPNSLSQPVGLGLGAQAGEERLCQVARDAGFSKLRRAAQTPVNLILELTP